MSAYHVLEPILKDILLAVQPLRNDWVVRQHIISEFRAVVQCVESLRGATVEPFGSFVSNLYSRSGDLDINIELSNGSYISSIGKTLKLHLLEDIMNALRMTGGWRELQLLTNSKVPILHFESKYPNIYCDISINNLKGLIKTKVLFWISGIDGRFRDLVLLIKEWAKAHSINNSKAGSLSSYSFTLLVIFHFQTCEPAILPPLKEIYPGNIFDELSGVRDVVERHIEEICTSNIAKYKSDCHRPVNRSSLSELFISFLAKFSDIGSRASDKGICPFTAQWEDIKNNTRWQSKPSAIFIEDPFEQPDNAARNVGSVKLIKLSEVFEATHRELVSADDQDQKSVVTTLVGPQISKFIPRPPLCSQSIFGGSDTMSHSHMQSYGATYSPTQLYPQFQDTGLENYPSADTKLKPVQGSEVEPKWVWTPNSDE